MIGSVGKSLSYPIGGRLVEVNNLFFHPTLIESCIVEDDMKMFSTEAQKDSHEFLKARGFLIDFTLEDNGVVWAFYHHEANKSKYLFRILEDGNFKGGVVLGMTLTRESWRTNDAVQSD